ncbi:MAG: hypothetical protein EXS35_03090 [Pedosphaera sp.]|nr:hypothetical protein [Pedosphaera sp.]
MSHGKQKLRRAITISAAALLIGCQSSMTSKNSSAPPRDINAVLAAHDQELLAIPGVVGVYVGAQEDGRTQCLKVMLSRATAENQRAIPRQLEGYSVVTEVTGEIRPLKR